MGSCFFFFFAYRLCFRTSSFEHLVNGSFFFLISSFVYLLSSIIYLSSLSFPLSSFLFPLSSFLFPLSSFLFPLSSFLFPHSSFFLVFLFPSNFFFRRFCLGSGPNNVSNILLCFVSLSSFCCLTACLNCGVVLECSV